MATTYSSTLGFALMATGENSGTWGTTTNTNLSPLIESSICGRTTASFTTDANLTIAITDGVDSTGRYYILNCTSVGSLTATRDLICPLRAGKTYLVYNATTGAQSIRVIGSSGTGITVPNGNKAFVYCDGTNFVQAIDWVGNLTGAGANFTSIGATTPGTGAFTTGSFSGNVTVPTQTALDNSTQAASTAYVDKATVNNNKIINGEGRIDQRYAGAAQTVGAALGYTGDRWFGNASVGSKFSIQAQVASPSPVAGVPTTCFKMLSLAATIPGASDYYEFAQRVEGLNCVDLQFGTSIASAVTLSFWVYSSITGTFGGAILNSAGNRSYPFNYTVGSTNTWTKISVTIPGDTTGTWLTTNGIGLQVILSMGAGASVSGTVNTWAAATYVQPTGSTNFVATNAAAMYVTAIKLEAGSVATPFVPDDYALSLDKCQRYFRSIAFAANTYITTGQAYSTTAAGASYTFGRPLRTAPTITPPPIGTGTGTIAFDNASGTLLASGSITWGAISADGCRIISAEPSGYTVGQATLLSMNAGGANLQLDAEL